MLSVLSFQAFSLFVLFELISIVPRIAAATNNASRMCNFVTFAGTAGMARMNSTAKITLAVISMTHASVDGCRLKMIRWTGHDTKDTRHQSLQVKYKPVNCSLLYFSISVRYREV